MSKPVDLANLRRVIHLGSADAARDAGLVDFAIEVTIEPLVVVSTAGEIAVVPLIEVKVIGLTPEQAAQLRNTEGN